MKLVALVALNCNGLTLEYEYVLVIVLRLDTSAQFYSSEGIFSSVLVNKLY